MSSSQTIIIIGGGQAAASCAAKLRAIDSSCIIKILSEESHFPYQRPPLSKKYATGDMSAEQLLLRPEKWYQENKIQFDANASVVGINKRQKTIELADGTNHHYDKLVFATGSRPRKFPSSIGGELEGVYSLRGIDDADKIAAEFKIAESALIIGGGYIGLEAAAVMNTLGIKVHLVEMADRILQRVACAETSDFFRTLHTEKGVSILENTGLEKLTELDGRVSGALLSNGETIAADFVLVGIGVIANDDIAEEAGVAVNNGILVNAQGQTSDDDIFAAGDCAAFSLFGQTMRLESVQNAIDQAESVAKNILGEEIDYQPVPWFWSDQYNVKLQIAGLNRGYTKTIKRAGQREGTQSVWYFKGSKFISVDSMNDPRSYMVGKKLLESRKPVTQAQIKDTTLELKSLL